MSPIYTAFYTRGTLYETEAARLRASLDKHGLEHDLVPVESRGSWKANAAHTATHIREMQAKYPRRPIVQLDADAVVWQAPVLFDVLPGTRCDLAVHYRRCLGQPQGELLNGTLYLAPTDGARLAMERYSEYVAREMPNCHNEQRMLQNALLDLSDLVNVYRLPASYCWIHDVMKDDLEPGEEAVIEHLQASRHANQSPMLPSRLKRLAEIEGASL